MSHFNTASPPRPKMPQISGDITRSPSPSFNLIPQRTPEKSFLSSRQLTSAIAINRSPSPAITILGRSPSPATATSSSHLTTSSSSPQSSETPLPAAPPPKRRRIFHRELKYMMHGFGDDPSPYSETVDLVEELVIQFITEMTTKAMDAGKGGRVHVNDIIFLIRKDKKKYSRVKDLLTMKEQIDKAKKAFAEETQSEAVL